MIKKHLILILESALYGFFSGALIWTCLYQIYEADLDFTRNKLINSNSRISISFMSFPLDFWRFCVWSVILVFLIRLIIKLFFQKYENRFFSWLFTGVISVTVSNLMLSSGPVSIVPEYVENQWFCCLDNSSGYLLWVITYLLIMLYTIVFVFMRSFIIRKPESFK
jgi:hypothetical protein